ncbi:hypothetical protein TNCV_909991 [Trichonephila clavipes]|nr:hypothetical protein TNCV_909992 [Trichonephila clavipes]GFX77983.1 hypothetical protein TNCV_909991 [Trichonephila clavipes]
MGHTQQVCVRIVLLPSSFWQQIFERSAFLRQQETDLPPAELWCACSFADRTIYLSSAGVVLLTRPPPCRLLHITVVLNDFHSRETTLERRPPITPPLSQINKTKMNNKKKNSRQTKYRIGLASANVYVKNKNSQTPGSRSAVHVFMRGSVHVHP